MYKTASIAKSDKNKSFNDLLPQYSKGLKNDEPRMWPSERIPQGGLFNSHQVEYSKETAELLKLLMEESRMSMMMRKQIDTHVRNGEPLPKLKPQPINTSGDPDETAAEILKRARNAKRKSLEKIIASGAYEPSGYRPPPNDRISSEKAKKQLQETMSGMRLPDTCLKPKRRPRIEQEEITPDMLINELLDQINERAEWLAEMEEIGEGKKYRDEIREQVAERLRQIKKIQAKADLLKEGVRFIE